MRRSTAAGGSDYVRVQLTTNADALDRDQQLGAVRDITALVAEAAGDPTFADRTWVVLTEAVPDGWGIAGHAYTNEEIARRTRSRRRSTAIAIATAGIGSVPAVERPRTTTAWTGCRWGELAGLQRTNIHLNPDHNRGGIIIDPHTGALG